MHITVIPSLQQCLVKINTTDPAVDVLWTFTSDAEHVFTKGLLRQQLIERQGQDNGTRLSKGTVLPPQAPVPFTSLMASGLQVCLSGNGSYIKHEMSSTSHSNRKGWLGGVGLWVYVFAMFLKKQYDVCGV